MVDRSTIEFEIDARKAEAGAKASDAAIDRIGKAMDRLISKANAASAALGKPIQTTGFDKVAASLSKLGGVKIDAALARNIGALSTAMQNMKGVSPSTIKSIDSLRTALSGFSASFISRFATLSAQLNGFTGPSPAAAKNIQNLVSALAKIHVPSNVHQIVSALNSIGTAAQHASTQITGLNRTNLNNVNMGVGQLHNSMNGLNGSMQAIAASSGIFAIYSFGKAAFTTSEQLDGLERAFASVSGSAAKGAAMMDQVKKVSWEFGFALEDTAEGYKKFSSAALGSGYSIEKVDKLFRQVSGSAAVLGLDNEKLKYTFLALGQMMSKQKISAEEMSSQLGEHFPAAMSLMAEAMGVSTAKLREMMEAGSVGAENVFKFGEKLEKKFGNDFVKASERASASVNRLQTVYTMFLDQVGSTFKDEFATMLDGWIDRFTVVENGVPKIREDVIKMATDIGSAVIGALDMMNGALIWAVENWDTLKYAVGGFLALQAGSVLVSIVGYFGAMIGNVMTLVGWVGTLTGALAQVPALVGTIAAGFSTLVAGAARLAGVLVASIFTTPLGAGIAMAVALGTAIYAIGEAVFRATEYTAGWGGIWTWVKDQFQVVYEFMMNALEGLGNVLVGIGQAIKGVFTFDLAAIQAGLETVKNAFSMAFNDITAQAMSFGPQYAGAIKTAADMGAAEVQAGLDKTLAAAEAANTKMGESAAQGAGKFNNAAIQMGVQIGTVATKASENVQKTGQQAEKSADSADKRIQALMKTTDAAIAQQKRLEVAANAAAAAMARAAASGRAATSKDLDGGRIGNQMRDDGTGYNSFKIYEDTKGGSMLDGTSPDYGWTDTTGGFTGNTRGSADGYNSGDFNGKGGYLWGPDRSQPSFGPESTSKPWNYGNGTYDKPSFGPSTGNDGGGAGKSYDAPSPTRSDSGSTKSVIKREAGGPVSLGMSYLTGERGPEIFVSAKGENYNRVLGQGGPEFFRPTSNGYVLNHADSTKLMDSYQSLYSGGTKLDDNGKLTASLMGWAQSDVFAGEEVSKTIKKVSEMMNTKGGKAVDPSDYVMVNGVPVYGGGGNFDTNDTTTETSRFFTNVTKSIGGRDATQYIMSKGMKSVEGSYSNMFSAGGQTTSELTSSKMNYYSLLDESQTHAQAAVDYAAFKKNGIPYTYKHTASFIDDGPWQNKIDDKAKRASEGAFLTEVNKSNSFRGMHSNENRKLNEETGKWSSYSDFRMPSPVISESTAGMNFLTGGSFDVPGNGSGDSTLAQLMLNGGERVDITPARNVKHNRMGEDNDGGDNRQIVVNFHVQTPNPDAFRASETQQITRLKRALMSV